MTHLPFIAAAYGVAVLAAIVLSVQAAWRLRRARHALEARH